MTEHLQAVILAAGLGKRMKSAKPKVLHEILGKPMLSRVVQALEPLEPEHIHIVIGHGAQEIEDYLALNPPKTSWSCHRQAKQLGTGHALQQVVPALKQFTGTLLVATGDMPLLRSSTLKQMLQTHSQKQATISLLSTQMEQPGHYGRVVRDANDLVQAVIEFKDATDEQKAIQEINSSAYCLEWTAVATGLETLSNNNQQQEYYLTDLIGWAHHKKLKIASCCTPDWQEVQGVNSKEELAAVSGWLRDRVVKQLSLEQGVTILDPQSTWIAPEVVMGADSTVLPGCYLMGEINIGQFCQIGPHVVMHGPVKVGNSTNISQSLVIKATIGNNCQIGPFAHLREEVVLADEVKIGNFVEVKKSSIGTSTRAMHLSYIGDATVGQDVNIGAGTITANYDHVSKVKSQTKIEDGVAVGSNSVLVAPVVVGKEAVVAAGTVVTKSVEAGALVVGRAREYVKPGWTESKKRKSKNLV